MSRSVELVALWGEEHPVLDEVGEARLDDRTAVVITRGRFPKDIAHVDPNEDAVLAARGQAGRLLAVADGHIGFDAARAALRAVEERAPAMVGAGAPRPVVALEDAGRAARDAVAAALTGVEPPRGDSRTALTLALVTDGQLHVMTYGDTACVRERGGKAKVVGGTGPFLGPSTDLAAVTRVRLRPRDRLAVASDGLTTYLGRDWADRTAAVLAAAEAPLPAARRLVQEAMSGGAGDHIAVAVML